MAEYGKVAPMALATPQRGKRLTPRFYRSRQAWVVDLPPDMNDGARGRKFFESQHEAFRWIGKRTLKKELGIPQERIKQGRSTSRTSSVVLNYLDNMVSKGLDADGIKQAKTCLTRFSEEFGSLNIKDIDPDGIQGWLDSLPYGTRTVWNHYSQARQLFNWVEVRRILKHSPFLDIEAPPKTDKDVRSQILTPEQMKTLLDLDLEQWNKVKVVLGGFAGLRVCELARMSFDSVDTEFKEINVRKEESKQGLACRPRSVTLQDAVTRHLPAGTGPLIAESKGWKHHRGMPKAAKFGAERFPQNALRHSFASYHLAHFRSPEKTAFEMGHTSPRMVYETYANAVSRRDAAAWWAL